jgi:hypothetical protein
MHMHMPIPDHKINGTLLDIPRTTMMTLSTDVYVHTQKARTHRQN